MAPYYLPGEHTKLTFHVMKLEGGQAQVVVLPHTVVFSSFSLCAIQVKVSISGAHPVPASSEDRNKQNVGLSYSCRFLEVMHTLLSPVVLRVRLLFVLYTLVRLWSLAGANCSFPDLFGTGNTSLFKFFFLI